MVVRLMLMLLVLNERGACETQIPVSLLRRLRKRFPKTLPEERVAMLEGGRRKI